MQKRAGLLFLAKNSKKTLLILENSKWTLPTFVRKDSLLEDAEDLMQKYSKGKLIPIELYLSVDNGFEYGTYICLVDDEFLVRSVDTYCWSDLDQLPGQLHIGLKTTLTNSIIRTKIDTVIELSKI